MATYTEVRVRIDADTKMRAAKALNKMGLSIPDAVRMVMMQIAADERLPSDMKIPNATTRKAMRELAQGGGKRFDSVEDLFQDAGI